MQWPISAPAPQPLPFVACCLLGLETSIGSNVMLLSQTLLLVVAVVFDGALLLPLLTTAVTLIGFGVAAGRADPLCFFLSGVAHLVMALLGAVALVQTPFAHASPLLSRLDMLSAMFCAVLCAEARVRAATSATPTRQRVLWACRRHSGMRPGAHLSRTCGEKNNAHASHRHGGTRMRRAVLTVVLARAPRLAQQTRLAAESRHRRGAHAGHRLRLPPAHCICSAPRRLL